MPDVNISDPVVLISVALALSALTLWIVRLIPDWPTRTEPPLPCNQETVFVFHGNSLDPHDAENSDLPKPHSPDESDWTRFRRWTEFRFGPLPEHPDAVDGMLDLTGFPPDTAQLTCTRHGDALHVTLREREPASPTAHHASLYHETVSQDLEIMLETTGLPVWRLDADGRVNWQTASASDCAPDKAAILIPPPETWPASGESATLRYPTETNADPTVSRHYDLHVTATDQGAILHAEDVTRLVQAQRLQRDFVQTLSKTFADLTTGLVIFDRGKTLALFNPALLDLTNLQPAFLSARPDLFAFFDALRDKAVMPEPRDYANWRSQIRAIVDSAEGGYYREIWNLPGNRIYRVTGRPHPDGAVAFLFENISEEVSAMRHDRKQIELRQTMLDRMEAGIAVFARDGHLLLCNAAFSKGFGVDPEPDCSQITLEQLLFAFDYKNGETDLWTDVHDIATKLRIKALGGGRSMVLIEADAFGRGAAALGISAV